jgi:hypothetical protein
VAERVGYEVEEDALDLVRGYGSFRWLDDIGAERDSPGFCLRAE